MYLSKKKMSCYNITTGVRRLPGHFGKRPKTTFFFYVTFVCIDT